MRCLWLLILFPAAFLHAMSSEIKFLLKEKYKDKNIIKIEDGELKLSDQIVRAQASVHMALLSVNGALPTTYESMKFFFDDHSVLSANNRNANRDRFKNGCFYVPINMISTVLNCSISVPVSSDYLADVYENRNNLSTCAGNAFMGTGLAINSLLISAGGSRSLSSNSSVKNTLNGISTAATGIETFKHVKQAYNLWNKDRTQAWEHVRYAGLFFAFGVMPYVLDSYQKKVTQ